MGLKAVANLGGGGGGTITGSGTPGTLAKFTGATALGDSLLSESGTTITSAATAETFSSAQTWTLVSSVTALNIQSGLLNLNTTNRRVGIGTTAPATTLETYAASTGEVRASSDVFSVVSSYTFNNALAAFAPSVKLSRARGTRAVPVAVNALDTIGTIGWNAQGTTDHQIANIQCTAPANAGADAISSQLTFATSLTTDVLPVVRMTIAPSGNVGIGTASPGAKLALFSTPTPSVPLAGAGTTYSGVFCGGDASGSYGVTLGLLTSGVGYLQAQQRTGPAIAYDFLISPNGGNVGIGTASPSQRFTVAGGFIATAAGYGVYQPGDHLVLLGGAGKNVHLKPNDGTVLAVNVGATSCDMSAVPNYGLKLPATPGNTDAQTLDCYAEGTWTPTLAGFVTNTPGTIAASYTRVGRMVTLNVYLYAGGSSFGSTLGTTTVTVPSGMTPNFSGVGIGGLSRTTGSVAQAIAYYDGKIYLGTTGSAATEMWVSVTYYV